MDFHDGIVIVVMKLSYFHARLDRVRLKETSNMRNQARAKAIALSADGVTHLARLFTAAALLAITALCVSLKYAY